MKQRTKAKKSVPRFTTQDTHQKNFFYNPHTLVRVFLPCITIYVSQSHLRYLL